MTSGNSFAIIKVEVWKFSLNILENDGNEKFDVMLSFNITYQILYKYWLYIKKNYSDMTWKRWFCFDRNNFQVFNNKYN